MSRYAREHIQQMAEAYKPFSDERGLMCGMIEQLLADNDYLLRWIQRQVIDNGFVLNDSFKQEAEKIIEDRK